MSDQYTVYVFPQLKSMGLQPDGLSLASIVTTLIEHKWAQPSASYEVIAGNDDGGFQRTEARHEALEEDLQRLVSQGRGFVLRLPPVPDEILWPSGAMRDDGRHKQYDFEEEETGLFRACYSDTVDLVWSPSLFAIPKDAYSDCPVPCPSCGSDTLVEFPGRQPVTRGLYWARVRHTLSPTCNTCGAALDPSTLVAEMRGGTTGQPTMEPAPFAYFALALNPGPGASPMIYPHPLDEGLLQALLRATSVSFRHVGRWS